MSKAVCANPTCVKVIDIWILDTETGTYCCSEACREGMPKPADASNEMVSEGGPDGPVRE